MDNVDFFSPQLLNHRLHPRPLHPHAGPHRVNVRIPGGDGDLCPASRLPRSPLDLDDPLVDLRNLLLKELGQHAGVGARKNDLRAPAGHLHTYDIGANPIPLAVALPGDLFLLRENRIRSAQVHNNILLFKALHNPVDQLPFASFKLVVDDLAFRIADSLHDVLLRRLGGNATERAGIQLAEELVADLRIGVELFLRLLQGNLNAGVLDLLNYQLGLKKLHLPDFRIILGLDLFLMAEGLLGGRHHGIFQRTD